MKAALISLRSISSQWTVKALGRYFDEVADLNLKDFAINLGSREPEVLYKGGLLPHYDCIYAKGSFRYADLLRAITTVLSKKCYMPIVADAITTGHDKLLTALAIQQLKVPSPKTYFFATPASAKESMKNLSFPIIMKFPKGTHGKGVLYAESYEGAITILDALTALKQPFLIQEYIETGGADIRAIVVGDRVVAAMKREAVHGEKRANIHAGGKGTPAELDEFTKKVAVNTAKSIGADICAVDILPGPKGPLVIEVNLSPGLQGITKYTKADVADAIAKYLYKTTVERQGKLKEVARNVVLEVVGAGVEKEKQLISNLDFRGSRILLPAVASTVSGFDEQSNVTIKMKKGAIVLEEFKIK